MGAWPQLAVPVGFSPPPRDQLAELRSEVEDEDRLSRLVRGGDTPPVGVRAKPGRRRPPVPALDCFAVLGGRGGHAPFSSSPFPPPGPAGRPFPPPPPPDRPPPPRPGTPSC